MYDPAITPRTLKKMLRKPDVRRAPEIEEEEGLINVLRHASRLARKPSFSLAKAFGTSVVRKKNINYVRYFPVELILRKLNSNLRNALRVKSNSRDELVTAICEIVCDSNAYSLLRLDIASFYECVDTDELATTLENDSKCSATTNRILNLIFAWHKSNAGAGLPRGLSISATLSEIYLSEFDKRCKANPLFFYYCRYADDIIIVANPSIEEKQTYKKIHQTLPAGLSLNRSKSKFYSVPKASGIPNAAIKHKALEFEYLGYQIKVFNGANNKCRRSFSVDIAPRKAKKIKTRVILSFRSFIQNGKFELLQSRLKLLTGNYKILDKNGKFSRYAGIYYSYPKVHVTDSEALKSLDRFLQHKVLSYSPLSGANPAAVLSKAQKRELLDNSFRKGFESKGIRNFSPSKIKELQECWKYV